MIHFLMENDTFQRLISAQEKQREEAANTWQKLHERRTCTANASDSARIDCSHIIGKLKAMSRNNDEMEVIGQKAHNVRENMI